MNLSKIFFLLTIICFALVCFSSFKSSAFVNKNELTLDNLFKYSLMIHLNDDELSQNRINKLDKIYKDYGIKYNLFPALHCKKDEKELNSLPIIKSKSQLWGGAWGLAGSFYKALKYAKDNNFPFLLFLEDDSIPLLNKKTFFDKYNLIINSIKNDLNKNNIYFLSYTKYCINSDSYPCNDKDIFIERPITKGKYFTGAGSIIFTKKSIKNILNYIEKNKIHMPIDNYINFLHENNIIKTYTWQGNVSKNGMFCGIYEQIDTNCNERISVRHQANLLGY